VPDPLARHEHRQLDVELDLAHLERRGVLMAHEVVDEARVGADGPRARAIGHARGLDDRMVVAHVVDHPDEPLVEHRHRLIQQRLHGLRDGPMGGCAHVTLGGHLARLVLAQAARIDGDIEGRGDGVPRSGGG